MIGDRVCVIEPHPDDAFLSLGGSIRRWVEEGRHVEVVTVYTSDEVRTLQSRDWAAEVGASWSPLGFRAAAFEGFELIEPVEPLPEDLLPEHLAGPGTTRIWPVGVSHPEHLAVAAVARGDDCFYLDMPYHLLPVYREQTRSLLTGRRVAWWHHPPPEKWDDMRFYRPELDGLEQHLPRPALEAIAELVISG